MSNFRSAWKSNRGNLLLMIAALATVAVSGVWYFDLLPHIELVSSELPLNVATPIVNPPNVIVVTLATPGFSDQDPITGYVRVHPPFGSLVDTLDAIAVREFRMQDGLSTPVVFTELAAGEYALSAFLDLNGNEILDLDDSQFPTEPVRLSNLKEPDSPSLDLEQASIALGRGQTLNLRLNFGSD